ncbi:hypothetical protein UFOVP1016_27 [uncultured Caudovirales phage]|uniref:Uncharacterized protein n=1 Tax=uncultured Caudovirales phage TaxID=2100421 RepID=A0A6J5Q3S9_9CAUD|nr:hypothetical protein UFOVP1016_27 [uncultured Caudovirales phage]
MATMNTGLLGDLFGGGTSALSEYLTPQQQESMQRQALLSTAAALLQAGGPSPVPISLGQALGAGLQAGTASYGKAQEGAIQQLLTRQKLDEYKRQQDMQKRIADILTGGTAPMPAPGAPITPETAISMPGMAPGPTVQREAMIGQPAPAQPAMTANVRKANQYRQLADVMAASGKGEDAKRYLDMAENLAPSFEETVGEPFKAADNNFYIRTKRGGVIPMQQALATKPVGTPQQVLGADGKPTLVQMYDDGTFKPITGVSPLIPPEKIDQGGFTQFVNPYQIKPGTVFPKTLPPQVVGGAETGYFVLGGGGAGRGAGLAAPMPAPAGAPGAVAAPTVPGAAPRAPVVPAAGAAAPTGPQPIIPGTGKAFANEKDLRTEFTTQMKPYVELAQAYQKIETAAKNSSPAGDIALVYGFMKVLDPGSVVREGEFATAANAGGVPDTVRNMYNRALNGQRIGENIRNDFLSQARNIIESQRVLSDDMVERYRGVAQNYKLDPTQIVFDPFKRMKTPAQIAAEAAALPTPGPAQPQGGSSYTNRYNLTPRPQ